MPEALASQPNETVFHYKGGTSAPANFRWLRALASTHRIQSHRARSAWTEFVREFVAHLVTRYGVEEVCLRTPRARSAAPPTPPVSSRMQQVRTWRFECWNEPNCGFLAPYGAGCCEDATCGTPEVYFKIYAATAAAVKAVDARLQVRTTERLSDNREDSARTHARSRSGHSGRWSSHCADRLAPAVCAVAAVVGRCVRLHINALVPDRPERTRWSRRLCAEGQRCVGCCFIGARCCAHSPMTVRGVFLY